MNIERNLLIAYMLGFIDAFKKGLPRNDRLIVLDQMLIKFNQTPTTPEEKATFLNELSTEIDATLMIAGFNRKDVRNLALNRKLKQ